MSSSLQQISNAMNTSKAYLYLPGCPRAIRHRSRLTRRVETRRNDAGYVFTREWLLRTRNRDLSGKKRLIGNAKLAHHLIGLLAIGHIGDDDLKECAISHRNGFSDCSDQTRVGSKRTISTIRSVIGKH